MKLDEFQTAAVVTKANRVVVPATAGSGKTTTMVARIKYMVEEQHIHPRKIAVLTFTRYAANGMKTKLGRLGRQLGFIGTIHAWVLNILKQHGKARGWEGDWLTVLDDMEAREELEQALRDTGVKNRRGEWTACKAYEFEEFMRMRFQGDVGKPLESADFGKVHKINAALNAYSSALKAENAMTFDMIIHEGLLLLQQFPDVLAAVRKACQHIVIDEVQDTDLRQWAIVDLINPESLYLVGDVDQSIYEWRGAQPKKLIEIAMREDVTVLFLPKSYRFGTTIANYANNLIDNNVDRLAMTIKAVGDSEGVAVMEHLTSGNAFEQIAADVTKHGGQNVAVLSRTHVVLQQVAEILNSAGVPYDYPGGDSDITKTQQHRIVKGILRLMVNKHDRRGFMAVVPAIEEFNEGKILEIRDRAVKSGKSLYDTYGRTDLLPDRVWDIMQKAAELVPRAAWDVEKKFIDDIMLAEGYEKAQDLLNHMGMQGIQDKMQRERTKLTLTTVHGAKGLEWPIVYVLGMNEGHMPSAKSIGEGRSEEERRCAYVAITRAQKKLNLCHMEDLPKSTGVSSYIAEAQGSGQENENGKDKT